MISPHLVEIERSIRTLSLEEQEWLLERIKRQVQEKKLRAYKFFDKKYMNEQLPAMANDLDIQRVFQGKNDPKNWDTERIISVQYALCLQNLSSK